MTRIVCFYFFFSSRRRHTRSLCDWSSDVCSSDLCVYDDVVKEELVSHALHHFKEEVGGYWERAFKAARELNPEKRSEERRVGKECRSGWATYTDKREKKTNRGREAEGQK